MSEQAGWVRVTLQDALLGGQLRGAHLRIDGEPVPTVPGENVIALAPGPHRVAVTAPFPHAEAQADVHVAAGQTTSLWYSPPFSRAERGRLGPEPQPVQGPVFLALVAAIIVVGLLVTLLR